MALYLVKHRIVDMNVEQEEINLSSFLPYLSAEDVVSSKTPNQDFHYKMSSAFSEPDL